MEHISNYLEQVKQELTTSKSGKIENSTTEDLKKALRYVMLKVGLRAANLPTEEEKDILIDHIFRYYNFFKTDEIKLAFDLAITNKLDIDTKDVVCYENFSCLYFSNIMNSYKRWVNNEYENGRIDTVKQMLIEYKPDLVQIEKEYQEFLQTDLGKKLNPKL